MPERSRQRPPLVLMINDHEWSTRSVESILGPAGYAVLRAYTGRKGLDRATTSNPDLIIVDANLPDMDGIEICRRLRNDPGLSPSTPIIVTSSSHPTRQQRLEALRVGAWDFLGYPIDAEDLLLRFNNYTSAKLDADDARDQGLLDQLTGLYNLQGLARRAREIGSDAFRQRGSLACVVFSAEPSGQDDIADEAETIETIASLAELLRENGRLSDAIGRVGSTEFAVFAPGTDAEGAQGLARRIEAALRRRLEVRLRAGYHAVSDFREARIQPVDMLERAAAALRTSRQNGGESNWLEGFAPQFSRS